MSRKIPAKVWRHVADRLRECNNLYAPTGVNVELSFDEKGDGEIVITPKQENCRNTTLCCLTDVVDTCRALGLTFYVGVTQPPLVQPYVRIY